MLRLPHWGRGNTLIIHVVRKKTRGGLDWIELLCCFREFPYREPRGRAKKHAQA